MKKRFKKIFLFAIVILSIVCIYPIGVNAISGEISYTDINDVKNLDLLDLSFSNIRFEDYSDTSTMAFGLTGEVVNNSNSSITYSARVSYYDKDYNLITEAGSSNIALADSNDFNLMFNLDILGEYSTDDIKYYRLIVDVNDDELILNSNTPSENSMYASYDYVIDNYDVNIVVNSNNTFDITERITAYFNVPKHGIFRTIPLSNKIVRLDGSTSTNRTQVTNLSVSDEYTTSRESGNYKIQIGSASRTLTGKQTYTIKYTYNLGKDPVSDYDELYYNIIGNEWDTVIGNVTFNITMPKEFDSSKLGFSSGSVGSIDNSNVKYNVNGNIISGNYDGVLNPEESLTVRCELPEGYFVGANIPVNIKDYLVLLIPVIFLGISFLLWFKFGRDEKVIETVEFYPPKEFNSLEVGFLYKGKADNKDVTSLLIYLANKGYIKISELKDSNPSSNSINFKITKLKEYDGDNINEELFLKGLFSDNRKILNKNEVTIEDLKDNFYVTMSEILYNINNPKNKDLLFEKLLSHNRILVLLMIVISYFIINIYPLVQYDNVVRSIVIIIFSLAFLLIAFYIFVVTSDKFSRFFSLFFVVVGIIPLYSLGLPWISLDKYYFIGYIVCLVCILAMVIIFKYLPKRTSYGNEILGKTIGFKNFLETTEKYKLEALVGQNPSYFYDVLPYTYVLDISDKWIKNFEVISMGAPYWYEGYTNFNVDNFMSFTNDAIISAEAAMSSSPSSSSGSSGGGSSGGGSGGGGGSSW